MSTNEDIELLTEHFGYPPVSLLDDIINSINILAERALTSIETGLLQQPPASLGFRPQPPAQQQSQRGRRRKNAARPPSPPPVGPDVEPEEAARLEIENGTAQLETLLCASIDKNFDVFEIYVMRNILCIKPEDRDWIQLAHYRGLDFSNIPTAAAAAHGEDSRGGGGEDAQNQALDGINKLRRRLQASSRLNVRLMEEKARNEVLLGQLRALIKEARGEVKTETDDAAMSGASEAAGTSSTVGKDDGSAQPHPSFAFLDRKRAALASADATAPLETTSAFVLSQLTALRSLSTSLRNLAPDLASMAPASDGKEEESGGSKSWRRERAEYVEGETRKHLEHVRGLELENDGAVRDGEWQGEGRGFDRGEAQRLEAVIELLGDEEATQGDQASSALATTGKDGAKQKGMGVKIPRRSPGK